MARAVEGVEEALRLRPPPTLVFKASNEGRDEVGAGECPREEAMDGRGEDLVDIMKPEEKWTEGSFAEAARASGFKRWSVLPCGWSSSLLPSFSSAITISMNIPSRHG